MRIAHLSDPHLLDLTGVSAARLWLNKRATGMVNLKLHRGSVHRREVVEAMMDDIRALGVDHVVITGDVTNLALDPEFDLARATIARLGLDPEQVSMIPGNHDLYTRGSQRGRRFARFFGPHLTCDLDLSSEADHPSGPFPYVRLRGPVAILGVSTAVARLPVFASGHAGDKQLSLLARALAHPEVKRRTPLILLHHPLVNPESRLATFLRGLAEAPKFLELLGDVRHALVLHGHLHDRLHHVLPTRAGALQHVGATSASLLHPSPDRMAGYNLYDIADTGELAGLSARVWQPASRTFAPATIRRVDAH